MTDNLEKEITEFLQKEIEIKVEDSFQLDINKIKEYDNFYEHLNKCF